MREKLLLLHKHLFTILSSITFGEWLKLLDKNDFSVDVVYWPRASLITFGSILNSYLAWKEQRIFGPVLDKVEVLRHGASPSLRPCAQPSVARI